MPHFSPRPAAFPLSLAAIFTLMPVLSAHAQKPAAPSKDLPNFAVVEPGVYRGGAPTNEGLRKLKALGVRTIVDLRIEQKGQTEEAATAKELGMNRVRIRLGREAPTKKQTTEFLSLMKAASLQNPIFIHCQHGADRTGAMVGIWRGTHDNWTFDRTWTEMRKYGFKPYLSELKGAVASACK